MRAGVLIHIHEPFFSAGRPPLFSGSLCGKRAQGGIPSGSRGQRLKVLLMSPGLPRSLPRSLPRRSSGGNAGETARFGRRADPTLGSKETTDEVMLLLQARGRAAAPQERIRAGAEAPEWKQGPKLRDDAPPH